MFLDTHSKRYELSFSEGVLSSLTVSGIVYSKRHWELSTTCNSKALCWGHRAIAVLEALPLAGLLIALTERIALFIKQNYFNNDTPTNLEPSPLSERHIEPFNNQNPPILQTAKSPWKPRALTIDLAAKKMWKNAKKAIEEHSQKTPEAYASSQDALPLLDAILSNKPQSSLTFKCFAAEDIGPRPTMEDAHFFQEMEKGVLTGVFDGHGGIEVAQYASRAFQERFFKALQLRDGNVHQTFESLIDDIHNEITEKPEWNRIGTTAVVCFIDKEIHQIYTATLGDSEANLYREIDQQLKSIPLSCVRDWSSKNDALRASIALDIPEIADLWPKISNSKYLRFPSPYYGVNVSRSIGDVGLNGPPEKPGLIHKPKIAVNQLKSGDTLVLGCDGLKDYVPEEEILAILQTHAPDLANKLVRHALDINHSWDNVTVLTVSVN